jgi:hypothetical protein
MKTGDNKMTGDSKMTGGWRAARPTGRVPDLNREDRRDSLARAEAVITYLMAGEKARVT